MATADDKNVRIVAKVGVASSNLVSRSNFFIHINILTNLLNLYITVVVTGATSGLPWK